MLALSETVALTRTDKRGACYFVEGKVLKGGQWLKAAFTAHAPDVEAMSRERFLEWAKNNLPSVTEDVDWSPHIPR